MYEVKSNTCGNIEKEGPSSNAQLVIFVGALCKMTC